MQPLILFYQEPESDRWVPFDRYPRKWIRRILKGKPKPGGQMMVALELMHGLRNLGIPFKFNDWEYARKHPDKLVGIIGKPHLLYRSRLKNPILFGASVFSHPVDCPDLFKRFPNVLKILVPGPWIQKMFEPYYPGKVHAWPVGIDTRKWSPELKRTPATDLLIYDKVRWNRDQVQVEFRNDIDKEIRALGLTSEVIVYGKYTHESLINKVSRARALIFLCEHETQGLAYQQILATGTPILAWDKTEYWVDPEYYPEKVKYGPVSAVPYWDQRCGEKFADAAEFHTKLKLFMSKIDTYDPRAYILENLTLEKCSKEYFDIYRGLEDQLNEEK